MYGFDQKNLFIPAFPIYHNYYTAKDVCGPSTCSGPGFIDPGYTHTVILKGLKPNTVYWYKAGSPEPVSRIFISIIFP